MPIYTFTLCAGQWCGCGMGCNAQKRLSCRHWAFWPFSAAAIDIKCRMQPALSLSPLSVPRLVLRVHLLSFDGRRLLDFFSLSPFLLLYPILFSSASSSAIDQRRSIVWLAVIVIDPAQQNTTSSRNTITSNTSTSTSIIGNSSSSSSNNTRNIATDSFQLWQSVLLHRWHLPHTIRCNISAHSIPLRSTIIGRAARTSSPPHMLLIVWFVYSIVCNNSISI